MSVAQFILDDGHSRAEGIEGRCMDTSMIIGRSTNQFGISRDGKDAFHPFKVDWTHLVAGFDELVITNAAKNSLFTLQAGRVHIILLLALGNSRMLSYIHMEISVELYVAGYKDVKAMLTAKIMRTTLSGWCA